MTIDSSKTDLIVFEYSGTPRSGKGTIVNHIAKQNNRVTVEETGIDYRVITKALLATGKIKADMTAGAIIKQVSKIEPDQLADMVATRDSLVAKYGRDSLYETDVSYLVAVIGSIPKIRVAVKKGFKKRVEAIRDEGQHQVLLIDGRNLAPVIETIEGTQLLLRTFVSCLPIEAAIREANRQKLNLSTSKGQRAFQKILDAIQKRNNADAERALDPVQADEDAIDYWSHPNLKSDNTPTDFIKIGIGHIGRDQGKQIFFDTTHFRNHENPKEAMLQAAILMFEEATKF